MQAHDGPNIQGCTIFVILPDPRFHRISISKLGYVARC